MLTREQAADVKWLSGPEGPLRPGAAHYEYLEALKSWKWSRPAALEVPLGELARPENLGLILHVKKYGYEIASITGKEKFAAQGLEGKAVIRGYTYYDALIASHTLPDHRFRIVVEAARDGAVRYVRVVSSYGVGGAKGHKGIVVNVRGNQMLVRMVTGPEKGVKFYLDPGDVMEWVE